MHSMLVVTARGGGKGVLRIWKGKKRILGVENLERRKKGFRHRLKDCFDEL